MGCCLSAIFRHILTDGHWGRQEIRTAPNRLLGYGHIFSFTCQRFSLAEVCRRLYYLTPRNSECGFFVLRLPALMIRDRALARQLRTEQASRAFEVFGAPADELLAMSLLSHRIDTRVGFSEYFTEEYLIRTVFVVDEIALLTIREMNLLFIDWEYSQPVDIFFYMSTIAHRIMTMIGFGKDLFTDPDNRPFDLAEIFKPNRGPILNNTFSPTIDKLFRLRIIPERLRIAFQQAVQNMRETPEDELTIKNCLMRELMRYDLLNNEEDLGKYLFSFCVEVYITIAVVGTWAIYNIASRTAVQVGIYNAVRTRRIRMPNSATSSYQTATDIDYLDAVIMETMRVLPVHGVIPLVCQVDGYRLIDSQHKPVNITRGELVFMSPNGFHTDCQYWVEAREFVPQRFLLPDRIETTSACFFPYPGLETSKAANFNRLILKRVLLKFYQYFTMSSCADERPPIISAKAIVPLPKSTVRVSLKPTERARDEEAEFNSDSS